MERVRLRTFLRFIRNQTYRTVLLTNQNARLAVQQETLLLANISASTACLLHGQCYTEKYVTVLKFKLK